MIYIMSDIHGGWNEYRDILEQIQFSDSDHLYMLGDAIDRGPDGIEVLLDIMARKNVTMLLGNHEKMMLDALRNPDEGRLTRLWWNNGAAPTKKAFDELDKEKQEAILDFLSELPTELVIQFGEQAYRLVHAAPTYLYETCNYKGWDEQTFYVWYRVDLRDKLREDEVLIFGHTPTFRFDYDLPVHIWHGENRIGIDCGCGHGTGCRLGCLRLDDMKEVYTEVVL